MSSTSEKSGSRQNIILVGLPGVGKTSVGRAVARVLNRPFVDFDTEIEHREHASVGQIFDRKGEAYFRSLEADLTRELASSSRTVMATGGGWVTNPDSTALLHSTGRMIYLRVTPGTALARMAQGRARRPLLEGPDPLGSITALYEARRSLYETADLVLDTEVIEKSEVIEQVRQYTLSLGRED
jgi:shikimate kinase